MKRISAFLICLPLAASLSHAQPETVANNQTLAPEHSSEVTKPSPPAGGWKEGTHYVVIDPPQPTETPGKIEVIEFFSFACPHCAALEPLLTEWEKHAPENVKLRRVHVVYDREIYRSYARLYYALEKMQRTDLYPVIWEAIHKQHRQLGTGNAEDSLMLQANFLKTHGIKPEDYERVSRSAEVTAAIAHAEAITRAHKVTAFPAMTVNGRYSTDGRKAGGVPNVLLLIERLIAKITTGT